MFKFSNGVGSSTAGTRVSKRDNRNSGTIASNGRYRRTLVQYVEWLNRRIYTLKSNGHIVAWRRVAELSNGGAVPNDCIVGWRRMVNSPNGSVISSHSYHGTNSYQSIFISCIYYCPTNSVD